VLALLNSSSSHVLNLLSAIGNSTVSKVRMPFLGSCHHHSA
jgi:hypothetical protein